MDLPIVVARADLPVVVVRADLPIVVVRADLRVSAAPAHQATVAAQADQPASGARADLPTVGALRAVTRAVEPPVSKETQPIANTGLDRVRADVPAMKVANAETVRPPTQERGARPAGPLPASARPRRGDPSVRDQVRAETVRGSLRAGNHARAASVRRRCAALHSGSNPGRRTGTP